MSSTAPAQPAHASAYRRLAANTMATFGGRVGAIGLALVLSTVLFRTLGPIRYGIWSFCYMLVGYLTLFDLGMGSTVERLVARAHWSGDRGQIERVLNHGITCALIVAALLQLAALTVPMETIGGVDVRPLRYVLPTCMLLSLLSSLSGAGLSGIQQLPALNLLRTAMNVASTGLVLVLALSGVRQVEVLLLAYAVGLGGAAVLAWIILRRSVGGLAFMPLHFERRLAREFIRFGGMVQVAVFGPQLADQLFRVLLGVRFGPAWIGYYDLGSRAALVIRSVAGTLLVAMVPFGVQQHLAGGTEALARLYRLALKYTALLLLPATAVALLHSRLLVDLWLPQSDGAPGVLQVFRIFLVVHALAGLAGPIAMVARAAGRPGPEAGLLLVASAVGLSAAALAHEPAGAMLSFGGASLLGAFAVWCALTRRLVGSPRALRELIWVGGLTGVALFLSYFLGSLVHARGVGTTWPSVAARGLLVVGVPLAAALLIAWTSGLLSLAERQFWRTMTSPERPTDG